MSNILVKYYHRHYYIKSKKYIKRIEKHKKVFREHKKFVIFNLLKVIKALFGAFGVGGCFVYRKLVFNDVARIKNVKNGFKSTKRLV